MLVTLSEILQLAEAKKCAVGSFNTPNLESIMAVIGAAEELTVDVRIIAATNKNLVEMIKENPHSAGAVVIDDGQWYDVGTIEEYAKLNKVGIT